MYGNWTKTKYQNENILPVASTPYIIHVSMGLEIQMLRNLNYLMDSEG